MTGKVLGSVPSTVGSSADAETEHCCAEAADGVPCAIFPDLPLDQVRSCCEVLLLDALMR